MSRLNFDDALSSSPAHKYSEYSSRDSISDFTGFKVRHLQPQNRRQVENSRKPGMKKLFNRVDFQQKMIIPQKPSFDKNILGVIFFDHRGPECSQKYDRAQRRVPRDHEDRPGHRLRFLGQSRGGSQRGQGRDRGFDRGFDH